MTEQEKLQLYRGYRIVSLGTFPMYRIQPAGSGDIPNDLKGTFTTDNMARRAIDLSLNKLLRKRKPNNVKETSTPAH